MLVELAVRDLGVIADLSLVLGPGMTALTGETGAGKTLVVGAVELLVGGRADSAMVRHGASEARVEGRFIADNGNEVVLERVVPQQGRSRAYVDGRMVPVATLVELGALLVDLHGQHAHQSLLGPAVQRDALDRFANLDLGDFYEARSHLSAIDTALGAIGGDSRERAREIDLLNYQLEEIERASLDDPDEEASLELVEESLADAFAHREASVRAHDNLVRDGGVIELVGEALHIVDGRNPLGEVEKRLKALSAELGDIATELRNIDESLEDNPQRLSEVRERRQQLRDLRRKYGDTLGEVMTFAQESRRRLEELTSHDQQVADLEAQRLQALEALCQAASRISAARREAAPLLGIAVQDILATLAMPQARFRVEVSGDAGEQVQYLLAANTGEDFLPLAKAASGGELARTMLALRLALLASEGTPGESLASRSTLIFDEVDAGIGGEAAQVVGQALASVASGAQVLVVTHLAQVAACADAQIAVTKADVEGRTIATASVIDLDERVIELSRMLSGQPDSNTARDHAKELLDLATKSRSLS
ncbi:MAG: DNA repair protein RecN [Acidimicrobiales bacterium]